MDFAQRVMELEMQTEFEESCEMEAVQELNQLYRVQIITNKDGSGVLLNSRCQESESFSEETDGVVDQS